MTTPPSFVTPAWGCSGFPLLSISNCFTSSYLAPHVLHLLYDHLHVLMTLCSNMGVVSVSLSDLHRHSNSSLLCPRRKVGIVLSGLLMCQKPEIRIIMRNVPIFQTLWMSTYSDFGVGGDSKRDLGETAAAVHSLSQ